MPTGVRGSEGSTPSGHRRRTVTFPIRIPSRRCRSPAMPCKPGSLNRIDSEIDASQDGLPLSHGGASRHRGPAQGTVSSPLAAAPCTRCARMCLRFCAAAASPMTRVFGRVASGVERKQKQGAQSPRYVRLVFGHTEHSTRKRHSGAVPITDSPLPPVF